MKSMIESLEKGREKIERIVEERIKGREDGEILIEYREEEEIVFDNGRIKKGYFNKDKGFGMRYVEGEEIGYENEGEI